MDKSWMNIYDRINDPIYEDGVIEFIDFAYGDIDESSAIPCPVKAITIFVTKIKTLYIDN